MSPIEKSVIDAKDKKPPFVYYYLRAMQEDGHMAWSSPIWVDYIPLASLPKTQAKRPVTKPVANKKITDDFDDDDDFTEFEDEDDDE